MLPDDDRLGRCLAPKPMCVTDWDDIVADQDATGCACYEARTAHHLPHG